MRNSQLLANMINERVTDVHGTADLTSTQETSATLPPAPTPRAAARLIVLEGSHPGRQYALSRTATIGRGRTVDVPVEDGLVSREHAIVSQDEMGFLVRDLGSRNGTYVNNQRIDVERIKFGDRVAVGQTVLLLAHVDPMHERLLERQKIEALGRLGAGIAHDLNNYFGAILGAIEFLDQLPPERDLDDQEVRECLDDVRAATRRGAELTQRLLSFARRGGHEHETLDVSQLCVEVVDLARRTFDRSVRIELSTAPGLVVRCDRGRIHQVLMNLLVNARDAMPSGGVVRVRARQLEAEGASSTGPWVGISVEDSGVGMDENTRARIFEPFFTTKPADKGTGLGLAIVLDVVASHGGTIECQSELAHGTTFQISLPGADPATLRREALTPYGVLLPTRAAPDGSTGRVLVVDDEPMVRRTVKRLLERAGYRVEDAPDGQTAVDMVRSKPDRFDVVVMDLDMPELDGESASRMIRSIEPGLPVVVLSGLCDEPRRRRLEELGVRSILQKPCDALTLRRNVQTAIELRAG